MLTMNTEVNKLLDCICRKFYTELLPKSFILYCRINFWTNYTIFAF